MQNGKGEGNTDDGNREDTICASLASGYKQREE